MHAAASESNESNRINQNVEQSNLADPWRIQVPLKLQSGLYLYMCQFCHLLDLCTGTTDIYMYT